ncbi:hypothetical protein GWI33_007846 [Rhynchophorus ferrugineus]|uniref:Uncharacterized protein n=1 Tax=Rhynchophorus ferrugineus TaxID=354439 RepID=A0A834IFI7_RHYFE|nr:hypothetical protein GWI33_007846 [Rhynchophorus ferrugineus]
MQISARQWRIDLQREIGLSDGFTGDAANVGTVTQHFILFGSLRRPNGTVEFSADGSRRVSVLDPYNAMHVR